jgi:protocatechuate 3,4-dioxygenase beta subunit
VTLHSPRDSLVEVKPRRDDPSMSSGEKLSRRDALGLLGAAGATLVLGCQSDTTACVLDPTLTAGPYWREEGLERSDIRGDTSGSASPNPRPGVTLVLTVAVQASAGSACLPLAGAQVDVWHCDANGLYSDVAGSPNTVGQNFLRGAQVTDAQGRASFTTIYPGWYPGRTVHVHVKVRTFDAARNVTTEATTQLFFDDGTTDAIFASAAPYDQRGPRDTRNASDSIFPGVTSTLVALQGSPAAGYTGTASLAVRVGARVG